MELAKPKPGSNHKDPHRARGARLSRGGRSLGSEARHSRAERGVGACVGVFRFVDDGLDDAQVHFEEFVGVRRTDGRTDLGQVGERPRRSRPSRAVVAPWPPLVQSAVLDRALVARHLIRVLVVGEASAVDGDFSRSDGRRALARAKSTRRLALASHWVGRGVRGGTRNPCQQPLASQQTGARVHGVRAEVSSCVTDHANQSGVDERIESERAARGCGEASAPCSAL